MAAGLDLYNRILASRIAQQQQEHLAALLSNVEQRDQGGELFRFFQQRNDKKKEEERQRKRQLMGSVGTIGGAALGGIGGALGGLGFGGSLTAAGLGAGVGGSIANPGAQGLSQVLGQAGSAFEMRQLIQSLLQPKQSLGTDINSTIDPSMLMTLIGRGM